MKEFRVSDLKGNEILAKAIYLEDGQMLLKPGTVLKKTYKESLASLNVCRVFVEDSFERYENSNYCIEFEKIEDFKKKLEDIISHHIYKDNKGLQKVCDLAEALLSEVDSAWKKDTRVLDVKERETDIYEHSIYTTILMLIVALKCKFTREECKQIAIGGLLHDLGFRYVNVDYCECCVKNMTAAELFELKKHTILAYTALEREPWISDLSRAMILSHHEKLDGSGYPLKQKNKEKECRLIQICDTFDMAMCGMECSKHSIEDVMQEISDESKYDQRFAEMLKGIVGRYPVSSFVKMNDGKDAIVVEQTEDPFRPRIIYQEDLENSSTQIYDLSKEDTKKICGFI